MIEQTFGPRRCRDTRKPALDQCTEVLFYQCEQCDTIYHEVGFALTKKQLSCCGISAKPLVPISIMEAQKLHPGVLLDYKITGGYNDNAVRVFWNRTEERYRPDWIYLKTFTGGSIKYLSAAKQPPLVFALADMDAFAYCDEDPCLECTFRCKRGFVLYAYVKPVGLIEAPLDKMSPYWQTK